MSKSFQVDFNLDAFDDAQKDLLRMAEEVDNGKHTKKMLRQTGNKLKRRVVRYAKNYVKYDPKNNWVVGKREYKPTGNLFEGTRRGKVYKYRPTNAFSVRVFGGKPAYHTNLLDSGHEIVLPNGSKTYADGTPIPRFKGYNYFEKASKDYEPDFYADVNRFIDKMINENLL